MINKWVLKSIAAGAPKWVPKAIKTSHTSEARSSWGSCAWPSPHFMGPQAAGLHLSPQAPGCRSPAQDSHQWYPATFPQNILLLPSHSPISQDASKTSLPMLCRGFMFYAQLSTHLPPSHPLSHQQTLDLWPAEPSGRKGNYQGPHPRATACTGSTGELHIVLWLF